MKNKIIILILANILLFAIIAIAQENDKSYVITLNYKKQAFIESLSLANIQVSQDSAPDYLQPMVGYKLEVISFDNQLLRAMKFNIPTESAMFKGNSDDLTFTLAVPYFSNGKLINIYDTNNNKVLEIPLQSEQKTTGELLPSEQIKKSKPNLNWIYISAPILLVISFLSYLEINRIRGHKQLMNQRKQQNIMALRNYATTNLRRGYSKEQIRNALTKNNYTNEEIEEAFRGLK